MTGFTLHSSIFPSCRWPLNLFGPLHEEGLDFALHGLFNEKNQILSSKALKARSLSRWLDVHKVYAAAARAQRQDNPDSECLSAQGHESHSCQSSLQLDLTKFLLGLPLNDANLDPGHGRHVPEHAHVRDCSESLGARLCRQHPSPADYPGDNMRPEHRKPWAPPCSRSDGASDVGEGTIRWRNSPDIRRFFQPAHAFLGGLRVHACMFTPEELLIVGCWRGYARDLP